MEKSLEIQVEEKQVAEIKKQGSFGEDSLEVTNSSIEQAQMTSVNGYRGDECQNHAYEETKSSESKRTSRFVRNSKLKDQEKSETQSRERDEQGEDRNLSWIRRSNASQ